MAKPSNKEVLIGLVSGNPMPNIPKEKASPQAFDKWRRDLYEWLKRTLGFFTGTNIANTLVQSGGATVVVTGGLGVSQPLGIGPLEMDCYADYAFVDETTPFGGTLVGTVRIASLFLYGLETFIGLGGNNFQDELKKAVRVRGKLIPPFTGNYDFNLYHDDGARFYLDGSNVFDNWGSYGSDETSSSIALTANMPVSFVLEVNNSNGQFLRFELQWKNSHTGGDFRTIPFSALAAP